MAPVQHPFGYRESIPDAESMNESGDQGAPGQIGGFRQALPPSSRGVPGSGSNAEQIGRALPSLPFRLTPCP